MIALLTLYDQRDPPHILHWTVEAEDLDQAERTLVALWRRHVRTECPDCTAARWTISAHVPGRKLYRIVRTGELRRVPGMPGYVDVDPLASGDHQRGS